MTRHRPHPLTVAALFGMTVAASCGGSSSETPWPVEPLRRPRGPAGEATSGSPVVVPPADASVEGGGAP